MPQYLAAETLSGGLCVEHHAFALFSGTCERRKGIAAFQKKRPAKFADH
ncbi:MAG: hypothetical protein ACN6P5_17405 [Pseudomonas protegens]|nr:hypothetical protein [Pseudomonas protegens]